VPAIFSGLTARAAAPQAGAIAGCVLISLAVAGLAALRVHRADPAKGAPRTAAAEPWRARAGRGWPVVLAAFMFHTFGLAAGAATLAMPWWSGGIASGFLPIGTLAGPCATAASFYATLTPLTLTFQCCASGVSGDDIAGCASVTVANFAAILGPAAIYLAGLALFALPAWLLAYRAVMALLFVARHRVMPSTSGCLVAGLPVVQGLCWFAFVLQSTGAAILFTYSALVFALLGISTAVTGGSNAAASAAVASFGAGTGLLGAALGASFIANVLYSVAGCCGVGNLPGVGMSKRNCCCTEMEAAFAPPGAGPADTVQMSNVAAFGAGAGGYPYAAAPGGAGANPQAPPFGAPPPPFGAGGPLPYASQPLPQPFGVGAPPSFAAPPPFGVAPSPFAAPQQPQVWPPAKEVPAWSVNA